MPQSNENRGLNDVSVTKCDIVSAEGKHITELSENPWNGIVLNESMGLNKNDPQFISGEVVLNDQVDVFNFLKLVGDEAVDLKFNTPGKKSIEFQGRVYSVGYFRSLDSTSAGLSVKFCSPEKIVSDQLKISRSYRDVLYSDMIKDLYVPLKDISDKKLYVEDTKNLGSMIVNNQSPIDAINKAIQVSRSTKRNGANYVFYEGLNGTFVCSSLESLVNPVDVESTMVYTFEKDDGNRSKRNRLKKMAAMKSFRVISLPNMLDGIRQGMYASTMVTNDLMKRTVTHSSFDYLESYDLYRNVNYVERFGGQKKTALTNNPNFRKTGFVHFIPQNFKSFDTDTNYNDDRGDISLVRRSQMLQMNAIKIEISVTGDSQARVGSIVEVEIPSTKAQAGELDATLSGRYLVAKVKHLISSETVKGYTTVMLLVKDSYQKPLPVRKV